MRENYFIRSTAGLKPGEEIEIRKTMNKQAAVGLFDSVKNGFISIVTPEGKACFYYDKIDSVRKVLKNGSNNRAT